MLQYLWTKQTKGAFMLEFRDIYRCEWLQYILGTYSMTRTACIDCALCYHITTCRCHCCVQTKHITSDQLHGYCPTIIPICFIANLTQIIVFFSDYCISTKTNICNNLIPSTCTFMTRFFTLNCYWKCWLESVERNVKTST